MTAAVRTGAIRAAKPAAVTNARRNRVLAGTLATCMVGGLAATFALQATNTAPAAAAHAPSVADITAAQPQSFQADVSAALNGANRDESVAIEVEPTPTPTPEPKPTQEPSPASVPSTEAEADSDSESVSSSPASEESSDSDSGSSADIPAPVSYDPGTLQGQAQAILASKGYTGNEWACYDFIISHESGWNPNAQNPSSGTYGLGQSMDQQNNPAYRNDPIYQINWALDYMVQRYGSPCGAKSFWDNNHWY